MSPPKGAAPRAAGGYPTGLLHLLGLPSDPAAVARMARMVGACFIPVHRLVAADAIAAVVALGGQAVPASFLELRRPRLVIVADDDTGSAGPDGWPQARGLLRWAHGAALCAAPASAEDYAATAAATVGRGRMLLVETECRHLQAWLHIAERELPRLDLFRIAPGGGGHPERRAPSGEIAP